ncbi:MAG: hypothetical protein HY611_00625 [Elusimicrobia bacterium]|nr:hypothetical protein [Elusimicrobiota bacterium]
MEAVGPPAPMTFSKIFLRVNFVLAAALTLFPTESPDIYWHLNAARTLWQTGQIPRADSFSYTLYGQPWMNFEWLAQALYYPVYSLAGMRGLLFLKTATFALVYWIFLKILDLVIAGAQKGGGDVRAQSGENSGAAAAIKGFALAGLGAALFPNMDIRPENFSLLFFTGLLWFLESARLSNNPKAFPLRLCLPLVFLAFAAWANLHAGFAFGLLFLGFYAAAAVGDGLDRAVTLLLFCALAAAVLGTVVNPYGIKIYKVLWEHQTALGELQKHIVEWRPASLRNPAQWPYFAAMLASAAMLLLKSFPRRRLPWSHILGLLFLGWASASHSRHTAFFCLTALVCLCRAIFPWLQARWPQPLPSSRRKWAAAGVIYLAVLGQYGHIWTRGVRPGLGPREHFLAGLCGFLKKEAAPLKNLRMFNPWSWGGYIGFELYPDYRVMLDGRYIFHRFLEETQSAPASPALWKAMLDGGKIDLVLAEKNEETFVMAKGGTTLKRPVYLLYLPKEEWALVYWDSHAMAWVRRKPLDSAAAPPKGWIEAHEYRWLRPGDFEAAERMVLDGEISMKELLLEMRRLLAENADEATRASVEQFSTHRRSKRQPI